MLEGKIVHMPMSWPIRNTIAEAQKIAADTEPCSAYRCCAKGVRSA